MCSYCGPYHANDEYQEITMTAYYEADHLHDLIDYNLDQDVSSFFCIKCRGFLYNVEDRPSEFDSDDVHIIAEYFTTQEANEYVTYHS